MSNLSCTLVLNMFVCLFLCFSISFYITRTDYGSIGPFIIIIIIIISYNTLSRLQSKHNKEKHLNISRYQQRHQLTQDKLLRHKNRRSFSDKDKFIVIKR